MASRGVDVSDIFPDPDSVGSTEYLALFNMVESAGHINEADCSNGTMVLSRERAAHVADMLEELAREAADRHERIKSRIQSRDKK